MFYRSTKTETSKDLLNGSATFCFAPHKNASLSVKVSRTGKLLCLLLIISLWDVVILMVCSLFAIACGQGWKGCSDWNVFSFCCWLQELNVNENFVKSSEMGDKPEILVAHTFAGLSSGPERLPEIWHPLCCHITPANKTDKIDLNPGRV